MPQPSACPSDTTKEEKEKFGADLGNAVKSIPAYVEKSDFVVIVAPGCLHADRRDSQTKLRTKTCYRTYRGRGWCVLELFAAYLSRDKTFPTLLITSKEGNPEWISTLDTLSLAVGTCNKATGANALTLALSQGPHKKETLQVLLNVGMDTKTVASSGTTNLIAACGNVDSDPELVRMILDLIECDVNQRCRPRSFRWKMIRNVCKLATKTGLTAGDELMGRLAQGLGSTALHYAVRLGDMEIVEILLGAGADPSLKNALGQDAAAMCGSFPQLRGMLEKRERKMKLRGRVKKNRVVEVLGKRISTATPIQHEMWLISLENVLMLYGKDGRGRVMEVHQELKRQEFLTPWRDVPSDAEIVFVSHEWLSWAHPDPNGEQLRVLCRVVERLKRGELDTEMDPMHTIMYKHKFTTKAKDWESMLKRTYFWVDWFSMPQPGAEKVEDIGEKEMDVLRTEGSKAIRSIPAYVERSDFILILVPSLYHSDRKVPTCYRTWRRRGWCLLELYAAAMARDSSNPPLLVRSEKGTPTWMSPLEVMKLSIGLADFTCCQRGHVITTETQKVMNGGEVKKIPCDKPIAGGILVQLIDAKINYLFNAEDDMVMARLHCVFKHWWMRGLKNEGAIVANQSGTAVQKFKKKLRWSETEKWFDCGGIGILAYAVVSNEVHVVEELLKVLKRDYDGDEYTTRLESRVRDEGYVSLGVPGGATTLMAAMMTASPEVVLMLLESGANVEHVDMMGNDGFMLASVFGRPKNLQCWLERVKDWDLSRQNTVFGGCALGVAVYMGANKLETVKLLVDAGALIDFRTFSGGNALTGAVENEDSDPDVVRIILEKLKSSHSTKEFASIMNYKRTSTTIKWKGIYFVAKALCRTGILKIGLMEFLAVESGTTAVNQAVMRGDVEIVKILLENGADPYVENDLGMNAFDICNKTGPFPSVIRALQEHVNEE